MIGTQEMYDVAGLQDGEPGIDSRSRHAADVYKRQAQVAAEYGLHPECMRAYLKEHEPELYARQGMTHLANGRTVSRRSMEKYAEAIRLYETTDESLLSLIHILSR